MVASVYPIQKELNGKRGFHWIYKRSSGNTTDVLVLTSPNENDINIPR